jgi:hypothetical protein
MPSSQRLKTAYKSIPSQTRETESSPIGFFSFLSSLLKSSGSARSSPQLSKRLKELMEKNHRQYRAFFANSLEKIKALLWSYVEHTKHAERIFEKELSKSIVAERIARQRREERAERKRLEKKHKKEKAQKKQLRRLKAKTLNMLASQRTKVKALLRKAKSNLLTILLRDIENAIKILRRDTEDTILQVISTERTVPISARTIIGTAKLLEEIRPVIKSAASTRNAEMLAHLIMERITSSANSSQNLNSWVILHLIKELDPHDAIPLLLSAYNAVVDVANAEHAAIISAKALIAEAIKQITVDDDNAAVPMLLVNQNYFAAHQGTRAVNSTRINFGESSLQDNLSKTDKHPDATEIKRLIQIMKRLTESNPAPAKGDTNILGLAAEILAAEELLLSGNPNKAKKHLEAIQKAAESANLKISFNQLTLGYFYAGILFDKTFLNKQSNLSIEINRNAENYTSVSSLIRIIEVLEGQVQTAIQRGQQKSPSISIAAETLLYGLIMRKMNARRAKAAKIIAVLKNNEEAWNELLTAVENLEFEKVADFLKRLISEARELVRISKKPYSKEIFENALKNIRHPHFSRRIAA